MTSTVVVYNRIKSALADRRKSNKQLAVHMDVSEQTVSNWCQNKSQPHIEDYHKIAGFLNKSVFEILEEHPYQTELED